MTSTPMLRLDRVYLRNFRCFAECTVDLHPQLTVLVAENGQGKTAVLDAISIAYGLFVDTITHTPKNADFNSADIRRVPTEDSELMLEKLPTEVTAFGYVDGQQMKWSRARKSSGPQSRTTIKDARDLQQVTQTLRERAVDEDETTVTLPLVAYYGTDRFRPNCDCTKSKRVFGNMGRMSGYANCLSASQIGDISNWYETKMTEASDSRFSTERLYEQIAAVEEAMRVVLKPTGWHKLVGKKLLIVEHPEQGRLPLQFLSDGVRTTIAVVMDIARRCVTLNPHLGLEAARQTPGVLLIDEVDLHLHPRWQQQVVDLLHHAFPAIQMILSTHSPQVLSSVDRESIRMIRLRDGEGLLTTPQFQTRGVESADILARIMDVDPIPHIKEAQILSNYHALIQQHLFDTVEAQDIRTELEAHFGRNHPVILECDRMIRLERFKQTLPHPPNQKRD